jgi:tRNA 2-thiouridine synthesizing protein B
MPTNTDFLGNAMLHIVKSAEKLKLALLYSQPQDQFILVEDAVYVCLPNHELYTQISAVEDVSVLKPDLDSRGLQQLKPTVVNLDSRGLQQLASSSLAQVDFDGFVKLTVLNDKSVTW